MIIRLHQNFGSRKLDTIHSLLSSQYLGCRTTIANMDTFIAKAATIGGKAGTPTKTRDKSARNATTTMIGFCHTEW